MYGAGLVGEEGFAFEGDGDGMPFVVVGGDAPFDEVGAHGAACAGNGRFPGEGDGAGSLFADDEGAGLAGRRTWMGGYFAPLLTIEWSRYLALSPARDG